MLNDVFKQMKEWKCDVEGALERFLDDEEMYMDFLHQIAEEERQQSLKDRSLSANVMSMKIVTWPQNMVFAIFLLFFSLRTEKLWISR